MRNVKTRDFCLLAGNKLDSRLRGNDERRILPQAVMVSHAWTGNRFAAIAITRWSG